jgi:hypothetical protein
LTTNLSLLFANGHFLFAASTAETAIAVSGAIPSQNCSSFESRLPTVDSTSSISPPAALPQRGLLLLEIFSPKFCVQVTQLAFHGRATGAVTKSCCGKQFRRAIDECRLGGSAWLRTTSAPEHRETGGSVSFLLKKIVRLGCRAWTVGADLPGTHQLTVQYWEPPMSILLQ